MSTVTRQHIRESIQAFAKGSLTENALNLFKTLGYNTERQSPLDKPSREAFKESFIGADSKFNEEKALYEDWKYIDLLFQLSNEELNFDKTLFKKEVKTKLPDGKEDRTIMETYLFFAIELRKDQYSRTELSRITREVNRLFPMPATILFKTGGCLTLSVINRRLHKKDDSKDVLEKVTLIKDIRIENPHRAHIEILFDLSFDELSRKRGFSNFVELHNAWQKTLDTKALNEKFYRELFNWYLWAVQIVRFPKPASDPTDDKTHASTSVIRLLTRLIFIWFIREKNLIPNNLFNKNRLVNNLKSFDPKSPDSSTYYRAILQNLFFATLNTEMNRDRPGIRRFITKNRGPKAVTENYMDHRVYRFAEYFTDTTQAIRLFEPIPFLNGGLFECLDYPKTGDDPEKRYDGFSETSSKQADVPNMLFFGQADNLDFSDDFGGDKKKSREKATGIIEILSSYKFTITENTPLEEEIALDPELLGKVFENLLASYTPETQTTARKQTGSFYTPREIVDYMADESLKAYLETRVIDERERHLNDVLANPESQTDIFGNKKRIQPKIAFKIKKLHKKNKDQIRNQLEQLFDYTTTDNPFYKNESDTDHLIRFISECKILDPACGSGAFPMGVLHRMVNLLSKLDPSNRKWKEAQLRKAENDRNLAEQMVDDEIRAKAIESAEQRIEYIRQSFEDEHHELDYLRKLFLIENCIFGVDIQQIAVQISKLRFFISLVAEQTVDDARPNRGVISLPNLETKLVAANTLIKLGKEEGGLPSPAGIKIKEQLKQIRKKIFFARRYTQKKNLKDEERQKRDDLKDALKNSFGDVASEQLAEWNPFDQIHSAVFFEPEWMFGLTDGFDIVIGNPPYVRHELIKKLKPDLKEQYKSCYTGTSDLYVYFFEQGINLLKSKGILTLITSNKYFRSDYGEKLRTFLRTKTRILQLIDFGDAPVFTAISYPSIIIAQKAAIASITGASKRFQEKHQGIVAAVPDHSVRVLSWDAGLPIAEFPEVFISRSFELPQERLKPDGWHIGSPVKLSLLEKLRSAGKTLKEFCNERIYYGIKTGLNEAFVVDRSTRDRLIAEHPSSAEVLKPLLRGRDIKRWHIEPQDLWLIFTRHGIEINKYPAIHDYLVQFKDKLMPGIQGGRKPGSYKWYEIQDNIAYWKEFEQPKIIWGNLGTEPGFSFENTGFHVNAPSPLIVSDSLYLLGILNSRICHYLVFNSAAERQGGFVEFKPMYISPLPIPEPPENEKISEIVSQILSPTQDNQHSNILSLEASLDARVAHLYRLTAEEYDLILSDLKLSEDFRTACRDAFGATCNT
ncbi:MAG: Eco57I restriction-modification methylase domain-containing protein [Pseudomonadota bacterium]|nr:Eco57I restriction-modification methylase domain-containing protein [Pseudomonadota bacterium]